jgi:predicted DsbA family dithiol-disulfide isomerase
MSVQVRVFTHPACPRCGNAVRALWELNEREPGRIAFETVSLTDKAGLDAAHAAGIKTIPTLIFNVDGQEVQRIVGAPEPDALEHALRQAESERG